MIGVVHYHDQGPMLHPATPKSRVYIVNQHSICVECELKREGKFSDQEIVEVYNISVE